jgi:hypothetical protein
MIFVMREVKLFIVLYISCVVRINLGECPDSGFEKHTVAELTEGALG